MGLGDYGMLPFFLLGATGGEGSRPLSCSFDDLSLKEGVSNGQKAPCPSL